VLPTCTILELHDVQIRHAGGQPGAFQRKHTAMFNPLQGSDEFRPALAPKKKAKFRKPSADLIPDKLSPMRLDVMLLQDFWDYVVGTFPTPPTALVRSWLSRSASDVDLCLDAFENVGRKPDRFASADHAYRTAAAHINRAVEQRRAEGEGIAA